MGMEHLHSQKGAVWHSLRDQEMNAGKAASSFAKDLSWAEVIAQIHQVMAAFSATGSVRQSSTGDDEHNA